MSDASSGTAPASRRSYEEDPQLQKPVFDLLDRVFPGVRAAAARAAGYGAPWESVSRPYVLFEEGRVVAHVGVIELPLVLDGRERRVGSLHAVATDPDRRRRGHFRRLMEAVLQDCRDRYPTLILSTENPEYYEPFGFRVSVEHEFRIRLQEGADSGAGSRVASGPPMRGLDLSTREDLAVLHRLLSRREPVSRVCGVGPERVVFCFNETRGPLWYAEDLDAICACTLSGSGPPAIHDVVAEEMPSLAEIVARLPHEGGDRPRFDEVVVHFCPDRLGVGFQPSGGAPDAVRAVARTFDHDGPSYLMARGDMLVRGVPFSLPRSART